MEDSQQYIIDPKQIYQTQGNIQKMGKALVFDLDDTGLQEQSGQKLMVHMTILFRKSGIYTEEELNAINQIINDYQQQKIDQLLDLNFEQWWGKRSAIASGELADICLEIRQLPSLSDSDNRIPHVELIN